MVVNDAPFCGLKAEKCGGEPQGVVISTTPSPPPRRSYADRIAAAEAEIVADMRERTAFAQANCE